MQAPAAARTNLDAGLLHCLSVVGHRRGLPAPQQPRGTDMDETAVAEAADRAELTPAAAEASPGTATPLDSFDQPEFCSLATAKATAAIVVRRFTGSVCREGAVGRSAPALGCGAGAGADAGRCSLCSCSLSTVVLSAAATICVHGRFDDALAD